jgi:hypothetical protein
MNEAQTKREKQLQAVRKWIAGEMTGKVEPWLGRRNPMITAFLKNKGQRPGPKGTKFAEKTAQQFITAQLLSLKNSGFYLRCTFNVPNTQGGTTEQFGTLISITKGGDLIYSCRERHEVDFEASVDFVENSADDEVADAIEDETAVIDDNEIEA